MQVLLLLLPSSAMLCVWKHFNNSHRVNKKVSELFTTQHVTTSFLWVVKALFFATMSRVILYSIVIVVSVYQHNISVVVVVVQHIEWGCCWSVLFFKDEPPFQHLHMFYKSLVFQILKSTYCVLYCCKLQISKLCYRRGTPKSNATLIRWDFPNHLSTYQTN